MTCYIVGQEVTDCPERSPHTWTPAGGGQKLGEMWRYHGYDGPRPTKFYESPMSYQLVKSGQLPPLEDRLPAPEDVLVINPPDGIGEYGGSYRLTAHFLFLGEFSLGSWYERDSDGVDWRPHIGKLMEHTMGGRQYTLTMRKDQKWSDGTPFTMEDVKWIWEDVVPNKELHPTTATEFRDPVTDTPAEFAVVDDYTWTLTYDTPNYNLFEQRANRGDHCGGGAGRGCFFAHPYMKQFYPGTADPAALQKQIDDAKVEDWVQLWKLKTNWETNTEKPCMRGWCLETNSDTQRTISRNHYFFAVDPEGNQLPYMDKVTMIKMESREVAVFRAMGGENDGQTTPFQVPEVPLYMSNMEKGDYSLYHWPKPGGGSLAIGWNQTYNADPVRGELLRTKDFRYAISHATDRDGLNEGVLLGMGVPRQCVAHRATPYYPGDEWAENNINYDVDLANKMLDDLGLTAKDSDGFRLRPDGSGERLSFNFMTGTAPGEQHDIINLLIDQWAKVGLELTMDARPSSHVPVRNNEEFLSFTGVSYDVNPWSISWTMLVPLAASSHTANEIGRWVELLGEKGMAPGPDPSYLPLAPADTFPADVSGNLMVLIDTWQDGRAYERLSPDRIKLGKDIFRINADEMYMVGTVSFTGSSRGVYLNRNNVRNQPTTHFHDHYGYYAWTFYFEDGIDNINHQDAKSKMYKSVSYIGKTLD